MQKFIDDDSGYLDWIERNPDGYVVNTFRNPKPGYLVLHRASCRTISKKSSSNTTWTEGGYMKVCASSYDELNRWAQDDVGGKLSDCSFCKPQ